MRNYLLRTVIRECMLIGICCIKVRKNARVGLKPAAFLETYQLNRKEMVSKYGSITQVMDKDIWLQKQYFLQ